MMDYYFSNQKVKIVKDLLRWVAVAGIIAIAATSPYFVRDLLKNWGKNKRYKRRSIETAFHRLRREGFINVEKRRHEYHVSLTSKGMKKSELLQLGSLEIKNPKQWDRKWRFLMFDVKQTERWKRDVLRGFLRRLRFTQFQKSVWVHPYECEEEVNLLQKLLELGSKEIKLITATVIGKEDEKFLSQRFKLSK